MRDAHGGVGGVDGLSAGTGRAEGIDAQILGFDFDVDVVGFGKDRDRRGGSMNAALRFRGRNALHAMHAAFVFQLGIDFVAGNGHDDFFQAAERRRRTFENFHFPALRFRVARVHAEKFGGEESRFVAAGSGANFHDDVLVVVGIFRQQQKLQFAFDDFLALAVSCFSSSCAICFISGSSASRTIWCAPARSFSICLNSRCLLTISASSECCLASFWKRAESVTTSGGGKLLGHLLVAIAELIQFFRERECCHF